MAHSQRLKLTLKDRTDGREWTHQTVVVKADPDDHAALTEHLIALARDLDRRGTGAPWWVDRYSVRVEGLDETWRDFVVVGGEH